MSIYSSINKKTNAEENKPCSRALPQLRDIIPPLLEQSPVAFLLQYTNSALVKANAPLMDKSMKILQTVSFLAIENKLNNIKILGGTIDTKQLRIN